MVANSPVERVGPGQVDYLLNRLADLERRMDQQGAKSTFPFSVGHANVRDFEIVRSVSGDGSADIYIGDGVGGKLIQVTTDQLYGTKIIRFLDQSGATMMSTDALSGYGWGTPSYPYLYGGWIEINMVGATTKGTAVEIGRGITYAYNPAAYFKPRIRARSSTSDNIKIFAQFRHADGSTYNTADFATTIAANTIPTLTPDFAAQWTAGDMSGPTAVFFKAYCDTAAPQNVFAQLFYGEGYGISQRAYNDSTAAK